MNRCAEALAGIRPHGFEKEVLHLCGGKESVVDGVVDLAHIYAVAHCFEFDS